jgi:hypothetical protein
MTNKNVFPYCLERDGHEGDKFFFFLGTGDKLNFTVMIHYERICLRLNFLPVLQLRKDLANAAIAKQGLVDYFSSLLKVT